MQRYLCWLAVLGVVGAPAAAAACWPAWRARVWRPVYPAPVYAPPPVYVAPPACPPAPVYVLPPPSVEPVPRVVPSTLPSGLGTSNPGTPRPATTPPRAPPADPLIPPPSTLLVPGPGKPDALPSLTLPPETPVKTDSTSRSSPLTGAGRRDTTVSVFPAGGPEPAGVYRTVGFYNHTDRDLS